MFKVFILAFFLHTAIQMTEAEPIQEDIPSLPYCPDKNGSGLVLVSTLDGNLSAVNSTGSLIWQINTGPGPLLISNIHKLELTNNGEWIRIIPSLTGTLYKFDGTTIDPIPITAENLLKSSFRYSDDLVIAGGIEVRTYGVGFRSGKLFYECTPMNCTNKEDRDMDDMLLVERTTHTIRAVEPNTGTERWNFSVGLHNIKLPRVSCMDSHSKMFDWDLTAVLPEGKLKATTVLNEVEHSWQYTFTSPIVRVWKWSGKNLTEVNLFASKNIPNVIMSSSFLPSIYIGMHNRQLYIHESTAMQDILNSKKHNELVVTESTSITKIPWKPIAASSQVTEDDSTALSVLNLSEYVNGNGYYLYTEADLRKKDTILCGTNSSILETPAEPEQVMDDIVNFYSMFTWWKEFFLMMSTVIICHFVFRFWMQHYYKQEVIIVEKPVEAHITTQRKLSEIESFSSPYLNEFETVRYIGQGGFGHVFEAKKKIDECSYAIKRITLPNEQKSRDRVMREVKALAKLEHKNIVRYFSSWVEHPPEGWQKEHDKKWLNSLTEGESFFTEGNTTTTQSHADYRAKRIKSASVSIEIPIRNFEESTPNFDEESDKESDDDSYIVFETGSQNPETSSSAHVNFEGLSKNLTDSTISSGIEATSKTSSAMDHVKRKIDWKRPGRRHHSWDLTTETKPVNKSLNTPPVYLYIQMQLCQKESLKEWLRTNQERDYKKILDIFLQILDAVEYVHLSGLIHRDLKPSNIFFSLDGQIKVGDFGLVKDMDDAFDMELIKKGHSPAYRGHTVEVGTQLYMSPEQSQSRIYDYKVDIYSLGLIFFELLVPFCTDMERISTLTNVKKNKYPKDFPKKYPNEYILLQNMLCQDPNKRLTTIGIKARPPFNIKDPNYNEDSHYRLKNFQKN